MRLETTKRWHKITDYIMELACAELDKLINKLIHEQGQKSRVCSQLVYQIYLDCGEGYKIQIHNGLLQKEDMLSEQVCLAELASKSDAISAENNVISEKLASAELQEPDMEEVFKELYEAMEESGQSHCELCTSDELGSLADRTKKFLDRMEKILEYAGVELPVYALFVAPCDLLQADNLDKMGTIQITRD